MKRRTLLKATIGSASTVFLPSILHPGTSSSLTPSHQKESTPDSGNHSQTDIPSLRYRVVNGKITGKNIGSYNNRPLYINNSNAFILVGDQPVIHLIKGKNVYGSFKIGIERRGNIRWLHRFSEIISRYQSGQMEWEITDQEWKNVKIWLHVLPTASKTGMAIRAEVIEAQEGDTLIWTYGDASHQKNKNLSGHLDAMGRPEILSNENLPFAAVCNHPYLKNDSYFLNVKDDKEDKQLFTVRANCSNTENIRIISSSSRTEGNDEDTPSSVPTPGIRGNIVVARGSNIYWCFTASDSPDLSFETDVVHPESEFQEGLSRIRSFQERLIINTPDSYLDAAAMASVAAVDGCWHPPVFVHGALQWNSPYPGWRTIFGGTMLGWHDRVKQEAKHYCSAQIRESDKKEAKADPAKLMTIQHQDSRFYGVGYIDKDQQFYNMQTQFFDQIIEAYRWTADPELISFFREALELHLLWLQECFDPENTGIYESYIHVWPTDSVWYNGGGTPETTSYAYRGHLAARDMAIHAGDTASAKRHEDKLEKIKNSFFEKLWIKKMGYSGSYREHGGHERLHENPWLYSIFLPADAGLLTSTQIIESLYYTEWALQNDNMPAGGRKVWNSNWVPGIWSIREAWPGDNYHLALSYFQAGMPDDGWELMKGSFMHSAFNDIVPGNLGDIRGGTDFGDCLHPFVRTLISGLFGYQPDYPNGKVKIAPHFPSGWSKASIKTPDFSIHFKQQNTRISYSIQITREAEMNLYLPVQCKSIEKITVNNKVVQWKATEGVGRTILKIALPGITKAEVNIKIKQPIPFQKITNLEGNVNDSVQLNLKDVIIKEIIDPQGILKELDPRTGRAILSENKGHHTILFSVITGQLPQWRVFRIKINDPAGDKQKAAKIIREIPSDATWHLTDIQSRLNEDVTRIYKQQYLSPRTNTVSTQIGIDGYSPWTFPFWGNKPPEIKINFADHALFAKDSIITPQGVPFNKINNQKNIAFTSLWDNYPSKINFPVNQQGRAIFFLVCGSTNVMQCQIANGIIRLHYADGVEDTLALIPPLNYWNLSPINANATAPGQESRTDYNAAADRFCMPEILPETVQLGENCRAMLLNLKLREEIVLESVTLETLSQEVVVGLMGITIMKKPDNSEYK